MYIKSNFMPVELFENEFSRLSNKDFSFFFDYRPSEAELKINAINIFAHAEPNEYFGNHTWIEQNAHHFSTIFTWNERIVRKFANAKLVLFGHTWIDDMASMVIEPSKKQFGISFIRGEKLAACGHLLRHQVFSRLDEVIIPTKFLAKTDMSTFDMLKAEKLKAHNDMMFSLVIENTSHNNYFSEKILDAMVCKAVPIYWGCTNVGEYLDDRGIIHVRSDDEIINVINKLTPEDYYGRIDAINKNYATAIEYGRYETRVRREIEKLIAL